MKKKYYLHPTLRTHELQTRTALATSPSGVFNANGSENETYGTGNTDGWF